MDYDFRKKDFKPKNFYSSAKTTEPQSATKPEITNGEVQNRNSQGSSSSNKMQKIQLSINKNEEAGSNSHKSNNSFRIADNLFEVDPNQVN